MAVVLISTEKQTIELTNRCARFEKVMSAIRAAIADGFSAPAISDEELNARIKRARRAAKKRESEIDISNIDEIITKLT